MIKKGRKEFICNVIGRIIMVIVFIMVLSLMPKNRIYAAVTDITIGEYSYSLDDNTLTASIIGYVGTGGDISIPATVADGVNSYTVTSIGNRAFEECSNLTGVTIPSSVTSIGQYAFFRCSSLSDVMIPDSVISIGDRAFERCSGLTSITFPDSVTRIGNSTFFGCSSLTDVTIPNSVTSIGDTAFSGCSSLVDITIPDSVTSIGIYAFTGCSSLNDITIPDSMKKISTGAFNGCSNLTSVMIPNSVTSIEANAFTACSRLISVMIPSSVTNVGSSAFSNCSGLEIVYYPAGLDISVSKVSDYGASVISYSVDTDNTVTLLVETIKSGTAYLELPVTINGKTVSAIQCAEGVDKLTATPDTPEQTIDTLCSDSVVSDVALCNNWTWHEMDKDVALTVDIPVTATAVYSGLDKAIYSNTEVEITIATVHTGNTTLKNLKTPTCGENGYTGDIWCETCNAKIDDGSIVPKTDNHTYDNGTVTKPATVTENGVVTYSCIVCKVTKTEDVEKLPIPPKEETKEEPKKEPKKEPEEETEKETEELLQSEEEIDETKETPDLSENTDASEETIEDDTAHTIKPSTTEKETGLSILFAVIFVTLFAVVGGGVFLFARKKR